MDRLRVSRNTISGIVCRASAAKPLFQDILLGRHITSVTSSFPDP